MSFQKRIQDKAVSDGNTSNVFLATTALEEFWDTTQNMVFLGDWCLRYSRRSAWEPLNAEVMPYLWSDKTKFRETYKYLVDLYELALDQLSDILNEMHSKTYSRRYWRIVIGPWLFHYLSAIYDRYMSIKKALEKYPDAKTICLADGCYVTPTDAAHFQGPLCRNDLYNLQLYSSIFSLLGMEHETRSVELASDEIKSKSGGKLIRAYVKHALSGVMQCVASVVRGDNQIISHAAYFSPRNDIALFLRTRGLVWPSYAEKSLIPTVCIDKELRNRFKMMNMGEGEFEELLVKMIVRDMPTSYIENYEYVEKQTGKYPKRPKAILSGVSWHFNEEFRQWAASSAESGTLLLAVQHGGGGYGKFPYVWISDHELEITDRFYSWGWSNEDCHSKVVPLTPSQLIGTKRSRVRTQNNDILFGLSNLPRYLHRYSIYSQWSFLDSIERQLHFAACLPDRLRRHLRVRLYQSDQGWDVRERWADRFPDVVLEGWEERFPKRLMRSRLYVSDQLFTTYVVSLAMNKPAIVFCNSRLTDFLPEAVEVFQALHNVGILHYSPESAARMVESVYENVDEWWNDAPVQEARKRFCQSFVRRSDRPLDEWAQELKSL